MMKLCVYTHTHTYKQASSTTIIMIDAVLSSSTTSNPEGDPRGSKFAPVLWVVLTGMMMMMAGRGGHPHHETSLSLYGPFNISQC